MKIATRSPTSADGRGAPGRRAGRAGCTGNRQHERFRRARHRICPGDARLGSCGARRCRNCPMAASWWWRPPSVMRKVSPWLTFLSTMRAQIDPGSRQPCQRPSSIDESAWRTRLSGRACRAPARARCRHGRNIDRNIAGEIGHAKAAAQIDVSAARCRWRQQDLPRQRDGLCLRFGMMAAASSA